jgi:hypothetical protein
MKKLHEFYTAGTGTAMLIGNPQAAAINAPQGKKYDAWKDAYGNVLVDGQIGQTAGALAGAGLGAGAGALLMRTDAGKRSAARMAGEIGGDLKTRTKAYKLIKGSGAKSAGALAGLIGGAVLGTAGGVLHGHYGKRAQEIRNRHLSANLKPALRELAARSEQITELAAPAWVGPSGMNSKGQRPEGNWGRAAGMGLLVGGAPGAILTQPLAATAAREGVIYRKRDAATDALRTSFGGIAGSLAGKAAGIAAQRFIPGLGRAGAYAPLAGSLAGVAGGLYGGYQWAKGANNSRIGEAKMDRMKTKMASAYVNDQIKKRISESKGQ